MSGSPNITENMNMYDYSFSTAVESKDFGSLIKEAVLVLVSISV